MEPYWQTTDQQTVRLYHGDVLETLRQLPGNSVQCVVTSPPYWGLRDYGVEGQLGGEATPEEYIAQMVAIFREVRRVLRYDGTLWLNLGDTYVGAGGNRNGLSESTLRGGKDYGRGADQERRPSRQERLPGGNLVGIPWRVALALQADGWILRQDIIWHKPAPMPESVTDRCTKAHEYVFLLTKHADYFCDMEAIKEKAEPAVRVTRVSTSSYVQAIASGKKPSGNGKLGSVMRTGRKANKRSVWSVPHERALLDWLLLNDPDTFHKYVLDCYQKGDVWKVAGYGYPGAHFATYPPKLIEPCILAGTSVRGACLLCGAPWRRVLQRDQLTRPRPHDYVKRTGAAGTGNSCANSVAGVTTRTVGWYPTCGCFLNHRHACRSCGASWKSLEEKQGDGEYKREQTTKQRQPGNTSQRTVNGTVPSYPPPPLAVGEAQPPCDCFRGALRPCVVLDPFLGSGTTAVVALDHGRSSWGIELSEDYLKVNAIPRIEGRLQSAPALAKLLPRVREDLRGQGIRVPIK